MLATPVTQGHGTPVGGSWLCILLVSRPGHMVGLQLSAKHTMLRLVSWYVEIPRGSLKTSG